jgi:F0F1-type ATP synthase assembly protein I
MARSGVKTVGAVSALGFEFVALVMGGVFVGGWLDERWGTKPWMVMAGLALALVACGYQVWRVLRWLGQEEE